MNRQYYKILICAFISGMTMLVCGAAEFTGKVIWVFDGDSFKVRLADKKIVQVRMYGIDAPEHGQPGADMALRAAIKLLYGKKIRIVSVDTDKYKRIVGKVYLKNQYINLWLLRHGYAWNFKYFSHDPAFAAAEKAARQAKLGIWKLAHNQPPWEYRRQHKAKHH